MYNTKSNTAIKPNSKKNTKKLLNILRNVTTEQVDSIMDTNIMNTITSLKPDVIITLYRNSSAAMQSKLWENDIVQRVLIFGKKQLKNIAYNVAYNDSLFINLENLKKVTKSPSLKKQLHKSKYFLLVVIYGERVENKFFHSFDINSVFNELIKNEEFNSLPEDNQLRIIERLNAHSKELLLPDDFRKRYKSIERLFIYNQKKIDEDILKQLTDDELFFIDYLNPNKENNNTIKKYIVDNLKEKDIPVKVLLKSIEEKDRILMNRITTKYNKYFYPEVSLITKFFHILFNEIEDEEIRGKLLNYLYQETMKNTTANPELVYNTLLRNLNNKQLNYSNYSNLMYDRDPERKDLKLAFYLKFNIALAHVRYLNGITKEQISKVNVKHINKLYKYLDDKTQDELSSIYATCIKMYFIFGYERSLEILNNKYGKYDKVFLDNISKTDVSKVPMRQEGSKYLPIIDNRFINFMFETPKNNHFINMLENKKSDIYKRWYYLYNRYDEILDKCHNEITMKKVLSILETEKYDVNRKIIKPDVYNLNDNEFLENIILGNKTNSSNDTVLTSIVEIYRKMKKRIESSIPYVEGESENGYKYQMMKFDDPKIFELGYMANCCIRTLDIAHKHLLHAALCRNGRILILYDKLDNIAAFCPLKRNGNVLIVNSIECIDKRLEKKGRFIKEVFKDAIMDVVSESRQSSEPIDLVCIGNSSCLKPDVIPFPKNIKTPTIYEKFDETYKDTDCYHSTLDIVYKKNGFNYENIEVKDPHVSYQDPRDEVNHFELSESQKKADEIINVINSINYQLDEGEFEPKMIYIIKEAYYSKDWYIIKTNEGIISRYINNDPRAKEECDFYINKINNEDKNKKLIKL